jgi:hypothetical protein
MPILALPSADTRYRHRALTGKLLGVAFMG